MKKKKLHAKYEENIFAMKSLTIPFFAIHPHSHEIINEWNKDFHKFIKQLHNVTKKIDIFSSDYIFLALGA